eukprot:scaffold133353_cov50-Phaeocystis_antarctica.AAC.1
MPSYGRSLVELPCFRAAYGLTLHAKAAPVPRVETGRRVLAAWRYMHMSGEIGGVARVAAAARHFRGKVSRCGAVKGCTPSVVAVESRGAPASGHNKFDRGDNKGVSSSPELYTRLGS